VTPIQKQTRLWLHGLVAAIIGGGAGAVTATFTASLFAPNEFNLGGQLVKFVELAGTTFLVNSILSACFYLKQSPVPPEADTVTITDMPSGVKNSTEANMAANNKP
jgi:hypothetical protein